MSVSQKLDSQILRQKFSLLKHCLLHYMDKEKLEEQLPSSEFLRQQTKHALQ